MLLTFYFFFPVNVKKTMSRNARRTKKGGRCHEPVFILALYNGRTDDRQPFTVKETATGHAREGLFETRTGLCYTTVKKS